ncbi:hypothetical protein HKX48_005290, partial [Thoreauomyces humboldtii]
MFARRPTSGAARPKLAKKKRTRSKRDVDHGPPLHLERILGLTAVRPSSLAVHPTQPILAYPAGGVVVLWNHRRNRQVAFLSASEVAGGEAPSSDSPGASIGSSSGGGGGGRRGFSGAAGGPQMAARAASCVAYSPDGEWLAVGEAGHQPKVVIWKGTSIVSELVGHRYGVLALAFSPDSKYLVSVGYQHDGSVYLWNWRTSQRLASCRISTKINAVAFDPNGEFFVTAGVRHIKFWSIDPVRLAQSNARSTPLALEGTFATIADRKITAFVDVGCTLGGLAGTETLTYAVTEDGTLMYFNRERQMEKWVDMRVGTGRAVDVTEKYIVCGGSDGILRLFDSQTLQYVTTLPKPHSLDVEPHKSPVGKSPMGCPDVIALRIDKLNEKVTCVYNDRSLYVWDIRDVKRIGKYRSFLWHSDAIWGVETLPNVVRSPARAFLEENSIPSGLPANCFATHSFDGTVRFWNLDSLTSKPTHDDDHVDADDATQRYFQDNQYSKELVRILWVDRAAIAKLKVGESSSDQIAGNKTGVRASRVSSDGKFLAAGDRQGNVRVYELTHFQQVKYLEAHDAEILTIDFSINVENASFLMATASRDRLLHVFDGAHEFDLVQTLDDHTSSVTAVRFAESGNRLISCGADKSLIFRVVEPGTGYHSYHSAIAKSTITGMTVNFSSEYLATSSQDRHVNVYSIATGKALRSHPLHPWDADDVGEATTAGGGYMGVCVDPAGRYGVTSGATDKLIRVFDFYSGVSAGRRVATGHSDLVTGCEFSADGRFLITTGADGCVFVWRVADRLVETSSGSHGKASEDAGEIPSAPPAIVRSGWDAAAQESRKREDWEGGASTRGFRYTDTGLPSWARASRRDDNTDEEVDRFVAPKGRWAQRVGDEGSVTLFSDLPTDSPPTASLTSDPSDRRYTFDTNNHSDEPDTPPFRSSTSTIEKVTSPDPTSSSSPRRGLSSVDLTVQDLDASAISPGASEGEDDADDDDDEEEETSHRIYVMNSDDASTYGGGVVHLVEVTRGTTMQEGTDQMTLDDRSNDNDQDAESPSRPVSPSIDTDARQSLSTMHLKSRESPASIRESTDGTIGKGEGEGDPMGREPVASPDLERLKDRFAELGVRWGGSSPPRKLKEDTLDDQDTPTASVLTPKEVPESSQLQVEGLGGDEGASEEKEEELTKHDTSRADDADVVSEPIDFEISRDDEEVVDDDAHEEEEIEEDILPDASVIPISPSPRPSTPTQPQPPTQATVKPPTPASLLLLTSLAEATAAALLDDSLPSPTHDALRTTLRTVRDVADAALGQGEKRSVLEGTDVAELLERYSEMIVGIVRRKVEGNLKEGVAS